MASCQRCCVGGILFSSFLWCGSFQAKAKPTEGSHPRDWEQLSNINVHLKSILRLPARAYYRLKSDTERSISAGESGSCGSARSTLRNDLESYEAFKLQQYLHQQLPNRFPTYSPRMRVSFSSSNWLNFNSQLLGKEGP